MHRSKPRTRCVGVDRPHPPSDFETVRLAFYREEFEKLRQCLDLQREYFSERAVSDAEWALMRAMTLVDRLCHQQDADRAVSALLEKFGLLARLSAWSDPRPVH